MTTEVLPSTFKYSDDDRLNLECLLDAFGSVVSLKDIASAYCRADRDFHTASDILCNLQGRRSEASDILSGNELDNTQRESSSSDDAVEKAYLKSKPKKCSASVGTVSGVIGPGYVRSRPLKNESCKVNKPLKLNADDFPASEIWDEKDTGGRKETMHRDIAEFLFKMLGDGFHLNMEIIQDVVGQCGYNKKKSMEKLLDLSASAFKDVEDIPMEHSEKPRDENIDLRAALCQEKSCTRADSVTGNGVKLTSRNDRLQKEILEALFNVHERIAEEPGRVDQVKGVRRSRAFGQVVNGPLEEPVVDTRTIVTRFQLIGLDDEGTDDNFEIHKRAAKEYSKTMVEYYKAAVEAYIAEDQERADKLLEEGQFFMKKAREADEKAAQMLIETRDVKEQVCIDISDFEPKDAVRHLKVQLTSLCGIPSIQYLKLIVGDKDKDTIAGRRKRQITKFLERDSLTWTEEDNGQAIAIPVADINPKRLSFAKK